VSIRGEGSVVQTIPGDIVVADEGSTITDVGAPPTFAIHDEGTLIEAVA
jgi:hypothetical protein